MAHPEPASDPGTEAFIADVHQARADIAAGRTIPYEDIRRWVLSWGSADELPPPQQIGV